MSRLIIKLLCPPPPIISARIFQISSFISLLMIIEIVNLSFSKIFLKGYPLIYLLMKNIDFSSDSFTYTSKIPLWIIYKIPELLICFSTSNLSPIYLHIQRNYLLSVSVIHFTMYVLGSPCLRA